MDTSHSRGAQLLQRFFAARRLNQAQLIDATGIKQYQLSKFASGARTPGARDRATIEDVIGIGWRSWDEPALAQEDAPVVPVFRDSAQSTGTEGA